MVTGNRAEEAAIEAAYGAEPDRGTDRPGAVSSWGQPRNRDVTLSETERSAPILDEEPDTGSGVANALRLAAKKGYFEKEVDKTTGSFGLPHLRAINYRSVRITVGNLSR